MKCFDTKGFLLNRIRQKCAIMNKIFILLCFPILSLGQTLDCTHFKTGGEYGDKQQIPYVTIRYPSYYKTLPETWRAKKYFK
jgi:hypothetical protein